MSDVAVWAEHLRIYAVDLIGEPGLSAPTRPPLASEAYALWLDDVLRALSLTRASIVGVSLGGWVALDFVSLIFKHFRPRRGKVPRFSDEELKRLATPVMLIVGGRDALLDSEDSRRRLERAVPRLTVRFLPEAGHFLPNQTTPILEFLRGPPEGVDSAVAKGPMAT